MELNDLEKIDKKSMFKTYDIWPDIARESFEKKNEKLDVKDIIDPYDGKYMKFESENEAYIYFAEHIGHDNYLKTLKGIVEYTSNKSILIGFSIGATAVWRVSEDLVNKKIQSAVCFYGSQIRNFTHISPSFPIELIFPNKEDNFDVLALHSTLNKKNNVSSTIVKYLHGFMNFHSINFSEKAYKKQILLMRECL
mgnify:CR=1 FL=1